MRDLRRFHEQGAHAFFELCVGVGHALVLMHEFEPGLDQEGLGEDILRRDVLEHVPSIGAVALALAADILDRGEEVRLAFRRDPIPHRDQNGALIEFDVIGDVGRAPVQRRRQIEAEPGLQFRAPGDRDRDQRAECGNMQRDADPLQVGDMARARCPRS